MAERDRLDRINLPLPWVGPTVRAAMIDAGKTIMDARSLYNDWSLAALYEPDRLPPEVKAAHEKLDEIVDGLYGLMDGDRNEAARQKALFEEYVRLESTLPASRSATRRQRG